MRRIVTAHLETEIFEPADLVFSVAVADGPHRADETLVATVDGRALELTELHDGPTRLHRCQAPVGRLVLDYRAEVDGQGPEPAVAETDPVVYLRPSRYVDSDTLAPAARATFQGLAGKALLDAVVLWVNQQLVYVSGSSRPTDGATQTYLARTGVCRDFAHLVVAMLRPLGVPARLVSVYAPGLEPMDFHAVAEALIDGRWQVADATTMAPRPSMLRIATGRDASDTAFMTVQAGKARLDGVTVTAVVEPGLPADDTTLLTQLR